MTWTERIKRERDEAVAAANAATSECAVALVERDAAQREAAQWKHEAKHLRFKLELEKRRRTSWRERFWSWFDGE